MKHYTSLVAGLALSLFLAPHAASATGDGYVPAKLNLQNSRALLDRVLPAPLQDPLQQEQIDSTTPTDETAVAGQEAEEPTPEALPEVALPSSIHTMTLSLRQGALSTSVALALQQAGLPYEDALQRALQSDAFPRRVQAGDSIELKFGEAEENDTLTLAGLTLSLTGEPAPIQMYRFTPAGASSAQYYDAQGYEFSVTLLNSPIQYKTISSFLGDGRHHKGLDLRADRGTPIHTPFRAQVERINWYTATQGRCVQLLYVDLGIRAKFFHLNSIDDDVVPGKMLEAGEVFAQSGNTGRSTGPHLHYQLEDVFTGAILDPLEVHGFGWPRLPAGERAYFNAQVAALEAPEPSQLDERNASVQMEADPVF